MYIPGFHLILLKVNSSWLFFSLLETKTEERHNELGEMLFTKIDRMQVQGSICHKEKD